MADLRIALLFVNCGPYHFARAKALANIAGIAPHFIQLVDSIRTHLWQVPAKYRHSMTITTLSDRTYEATDYWRLSGRLRRKLDEVDPAVVFTSSYRPLVMLSAAQWAKSRNRRAVLCFDSTAWDRPRYKPAETIKRALISYYYDAAFVGGRAHRQYLAQFGMAPTRTWQPYNVVDNEYFAANDARNRLAQPHWRWVLNLPDHYFLYVGRYAPEKNLRRLLDAYRIYRLGCANPWSLLLVGDGPQRSELEALASSSRLKGIIFRPFTQIDDLSAYYSFAECLVLPSTSEPWGLVVNEAMACGLPVAVSKLCGCAPELVQQGRNGLCFDPYDSEELAASLAKVAALEPEERRLMGERSRVMVSSFTPQNWGTNVAHCAQTLVAENGS